LVERSRLREVFFLKGNHEAYVIEFLQNPQVLEPWKQFGGYETLMSYGLKPSTKMDSSRQGQLAREFDEILPEAHRQFLRSLRSSFSCGDFFFVHAGIKPGIPLNAQEEQDLISIREDFLHCEEDYGKIIIHGHTPVREPDVRSNRINIDTGAFATGRLTCLMLEGDEAAFIAEGREWLYHPNREPNGAIAAQKVLAAPRTDAGRHRADLKAGPGPAGTRTSFQSEPSNDGLKGRSSGLNTYGRKPLVPALATLAAAIVASLLLLLPSLTSRERSAAEVLSQTQGGPPVIASEKARLAAVEPSPLSSLAPPFY
jgi:hypothetical protein